MSVTVGRAKLMGALKDLKLRWDKAKLNWDDPMSADIEKTVIDPLEPQVRATVGAMERINEVLMKARRDCEPSS
jgi:hypothetical protein